MFKSLKSYQKENREKIDSQTSIRLEKRQLDFIKKNNLNLSKLIRDFIDSLISESEKNKKDGS